MMARLDILADTGDRFETIEVIIFVVLIGISIIGGLIQQAIKKQQEKRAEEARRQQRERAAEGRGIQPAPQRQPQQPPQRRQQQPQPMPSLVRQVRQMFGLQQKAPRRAGGAPPFPQPAAPQAEVVLEPARRARRAARLRAKRPTLAAPQPPPAAMPDATPTEGPPVPVALSSPEQARFAIIYHEILGPPKALRGREEMWDA